MPVAPARPWKLTSFRWSGLVPNMRPYTDKIRKECLVVAHNHRSRNGRKRSEADVVGSDLADFGRGVHGNWVRGASRILEVLKGAGARGRPTPPRKNAGIARPRRAATAPRPKFCHETDRRT